MFPGGVVQEAKRLGQQRRSIRKLLESFKSAVEARAIDSFWQSRKKGNLRRRPEVIAQSLLSLFAMGVVGDSGLVMREVSSGIGFVDVQIQFSSVPHLIEVKILKGDFQGVDQLADYLRTENRSVGWLVQIDVRPSNSKATIPAKLTQASMTIHVITIDVNPPVPSRR